METLEEISHRLEVAKDLQSVVRTMKTISMVGIHRHELAERATCHYLETVELGLQVALRALDDPGRELQPAQGTGSAIVVIGSEIGLCGGFNEQLVDFTLESLTASSNKPEQRLVLTIGARANASWRAIAGPPAAHEEAPETVEAIARTAGTVLTRLDQWQKEQGITRLELFHHRPTEQGRSILVLEQLLPLDHAWLAALRARPWSSRRLPIPGGSPEALLRNLIRQLFFARTFTALIQSRTAELAVRLAAMQAADRSIAEKIDDLQKTHRRARQDLITSELLDLVSGYEAVTSDKER